MSAHADRSARRRPRAAPPRSRPRSTLRLAPRRAPRGGSRSRIEWDRFGRIVLVLVLFTIMALYLNPIRGFFDAWSERGAEEQRLTEVRAEHHDLAKRAEALTDPDALEREARKLGMVAAGERSYVIRGLGR